MEIGRRRRTSWAQSLKLRPNDSEAQALLNSWKQPAVAGTASADPLERIVRTFDAAAFRQASLMLDQMDASQLAALAPLEQAQKLCTQAKGYLDRGLLLEAERLYQAAVADYPKAGEAHAGLAEVRQRSGDAEGARKEAHAALEVGPSSAAYLVLAQLDLAANNLNDAVAEANDALKLEPTNTAAQEVLRQISTTGGQSK